MTTIEEKKQELITLMTEYSQLKGDNDNKARCLVVKNKAAQIMYTGNFFKHLCKRAKDRSEGYGTRYEPDEFVSETFLKYFDQYDHNRNNNFYSYFMYYLKFTISNMIKKEHPNHYPPMPTSTDEDGNEYDWSEKTPDNETNPETISIIKSLSVIFGDIPTTEEEANDMLCFCEYLTKIIPCVLHVKKHQAGNEKKYEYFSAFATDFFISICKTGLSTKYDMNENDVFSAVDLAFADFVLVRKCRTFQEFMDSPCKEYSDLGLFPKPDARKSEEKQLYCVGKLHVPFKNPVYRVYHHVKRDGSISQKRTAFRKELWKYESEELE